MDDFDIPIFKKSYELYKTLYEIRLKVPKQDRYTLWQKCEDTSIKIIEGILKATSTKKEERLAILENTSNDLNILRVFVRLAKDTRVIDQSKYEIVQSSIDEIGRMLGGWIRSTKV